MILNVHVARSIETGVGRLFPGYKFSSLANEVGTYNKVSYSKTHTKQVSENLRQKLKQQRRYNNFTIIFYWKLWQPKGNAVLCSSLAERKDCKCVF